MEKQWIEGRLGHNHQNGRYGLLISDLWEKEGFNCGEYLQVKVGGEWVDTCMEMEWSKGVGVWYLAGTGIKGEAIEHTHARIRK